MSLFARNSVRRCCLAVAISLGLAATVPALAQQPTTRYELNLPGQPLGDALIALGKATHLNIAFEPASVAGLSAPVLVGDYTAEEALDRLLKGSGLSARRTQGGSYTVEPSAKNKYQGTQPAGTHDKKTTGDSAQTLDTVVVTAHVQGFSATRLSTELKEIPQSVTVVDQQTLQKQNAYDLATAFNWIPGITLTQGSTTMNTPATARGFSINTLHIDGGAPITIGYAAGQNQRIDLSQYESIELLRGADALFGGIGDPGGSIHLTRKRPQAEASTNIAVSAGSWNHYRVEADINTGSITDSGRLRGRLVAVDESQHYFYRTAKSHMNKLYGVVDYDLAPHTLLRVGGAAERTPDYIPFTNGLPRYTDGGDAHWPRSTALTFPWLRNSSASKEGFVQLEHSFNQRWQVKTGVARTVQDDSSMTSSFPSGGVSRRPSPFPAALTVNPGHSHATQTTADLTLTGRFDWNGRTQELAFGFDASRRDIRSNVDFFLLAGPALDPHHFDPSAYPEPTGAPLFSVKNTGNSRERGVFASLKLRPVDGLAITAGARSTFSRQEATAQTQVGTLHLPPTIAKGSSPGVITPLLGVVYDINPTYSLYASYADTSQGFSSLPPMTAHGELLPPSRGTNTELGLKAGWDEGRLNGSLALFDIRRDNVAIRDPAAPIGPRGANCCYLATVQRSKGFEAELTGQLAPGWQLSAGYTFDINRQGNGSTLSTVTPKHLFKLWTNYQLPAGAGAWEIGGGITAQTKNYLNATACLGTYNPLSGRCSRPLTPFRAQQGFYTVATLRVGYRVNERWNLALNLNNLFDRRYYQTVGYVAGGNWYGTPRNWMLTLRGEL